MKIKDIVSALIAGSFLLLTVLICGGCRDNSPLIYSTIQEAAEKGDLADVKRHIQHGADVNDDEYRGLRPLYLATKEGHLEVALYLISKGADVNAKNIAGYTPLYFAVDRNDKFLVMMLLDLSADPNSKLTLTGQTLLHQAAIKGYLDIARILIKHDAEVNAKDIYLCTPCQWAAFFGHTDLVELLRKHGATDCDKPPLGFQELPELIP